MGKTVTTASLPQSWPDTYITKSFFGHDIITFGYSEGVDIKCRPEDTFEDILSRLPQGWVPDVCICTHIDWVFIPPGIEKAAFPIVNITADWDYRIAIAKTCADIFDMTIVLGDDSKKSVESLGAQNVYPFHYFGVLKEHIHNDIDSIKERKFDISFTGAINDVSHLDRSKWLLRLCNLSDRYNIYINYPGSSIDEYLDILKKSRLVFTFHRRGELQLRFTDASSQGALVLDSGKETAKYFNAGKEYASFNEENFEKVIEKYLNDENLRRETVKKSYRRSCKEFESRDRFKELIDFIEGKFAEISKVKRRFAELPEEIKLLRRAETFYYNFYETFIPRHISFLFTSARLLQQALDIKKTPRLSTTLAVVNSSIGFNTGDDFKTSRHIGDAIKILKNTINEFPDYAMAYFNLAFIYFSIDEKKFAERNFRSAINLMEKNPEHLDPWCLYNFEHHKKSQDFKKILNDCLILISEKNNSRGLRTANNILISTCWYFIGKILLSEGKSYEALECWHKSVSKNCERGKILKETAELTDILGDKDTCLKMFSKTVDLLPLDVEARCSFIKFLYRHKIYDKCLDECRQAIKICKTIRAFRLNINAVKKILLFLERKIGNKDYVLETVDAIEWEFLLNAIEFLSLAQSKNPSDNRLLLRGASLLISADRQDDAISILEKIKGKLQADEQTEINGALTDLYRYKLKESRNTIRHYQKKNLKIHKRTNTHSGKSSNPEISVLVRTFNRPFLLKECLGSLLEQKFKNFEVVLVNDGGVDVRNIVSEFSKNISITEVNHALNLGRSAAWNSAVKVARGKFISFLDDDDIYYPSHLKNLLEAIKREKMKVAYSNCYSVREMPSENGFSKQIKEIYKTEDFIPELFLMKNYIPIITLMAEKEAVEDAGLFDENFEVHEDWDMLVRLSLGNVFFHLKEITAEYRIRSDNTNSCTAERGKYLDSLIMLYKKYDYLAKNNSEILRVQKNNMKLLRSELQGRKDKNINIEKCLSA